MTKMIRLPLTLQEALTHLNEGKISSEELTKAMLDLIKKHNPELHAFISINNEALNEAKKTDKLRKNGVRKKLLGIPVAIKDNFVTRDLRTTASSLVLDDYKPQYDATIVKRLRQAGAVIIGKSNLDAWGHGSSGEHTDYGATKNPYSYDHVTGGSSSGSAGAVASGLCYMGTGSDTGGSNRQPGSYCNVVGLKPTYGRVSRYGLIAMASSTDSPGTLTKTVWDTAICMSVISGHDPLDANTSDQPVPNYHKKLNNKYKAKIGIADEYFDGLDEGVSKSVMNALKILEKKGHKLVKISLPTVKYAYPIYALITFSEISSNLSRFDGIRYGNTREKFADEARRRIIVGTHSLSAGYADKYYKKAAKARTRLIYDFAKAFENVDIIAGAVFPFPPFKHDERETDPLKMYLSDLLTVPANLIGAPAISVPVEFVKRFPNGLQLIAPQFAEQKIFDVGYQIEQELEVYEIKPKLKA